MNPYDLLCAVVTALAASVWIYVAWLVARFMS